MGPGLSPETFFAHRAARAGSPSLLLDIFSGGVGGIALVLFRAVAVEGFHANDVFPAVRCVDIPVLFELGEGPLDVRF